MAKTVVAEEATGRVALGTGDAAGLIYSMQSFAKIRRVEKCAERTNAMGVVPELSVSTRTDARWTRQIQRGFALG